MKKRTLGRGLQVSAIGLGCMGFAQGATPSVHRGEAIRLLRRAVDWGESFFDTSELYGIYKNEELVGEALEAVRDRVVLAAKYSPNIQNDIQSGKVQGQNSSPAAIRKAVEGSLKRLCTDHIDLYYQQCADPNLPIEEIAGVMADLIQEGKILHWGLSEAAPTTVRRAHKICPVTAVQNEYSLWYREPEKELLPTLEELDIGLVAFRPLGKGFLTGALEADEKIGRGEIRSSTPRFNATQSPPHNQALAQAVADFARRRELFPAQVALAWLLAQRPWIVPIPGARHEECLQQNLSAAYVPLTAADLAALDALTRQFAAKGTRCAPEQQGMANR